MSDDKNCKYGDPIADAVPGYTLAQYHEMQARFVKAMLNARKQKLERFSIGIVTAGEE